MGYKKEERKGDYYTIERVLDILDILHKKTDERHYLSQPELLALLKEKGHECCEKTLTNTLKTLLETVNPLDDEDGGIPEGYNIEDYKIVVKGLQNKIKARELGLSEKAKKKLQIRGLRLNREFSYKDVDRLVEAVLFLKNISDEERTYLIEKLQTLTSCYYPDYSAYLSSTTGKLNTKLTSVYENSRIDEEIVRENIKIITNAIEKDKKGCKITFHFGGNTKDNKFVYRKNRNGEIMEYVADPYYIVLYGGKYYLICSAFNKKNVSMYRIDLMRDISFALKDSPISDKKSVIYRTPKDEVKGLPIYWNSEVASKFLSEHLYMFYGEPKQIDIKIDSMRYPLLYDFFGENFKFKKHHDETWDIITVKCVPEALKRWALQNHDYVEIMDEKLREEMAEECEKLMMKYKNAN